MTFISEPELDKRKYAEEILGGTPSIEDVIQKVAELEYLEEIEVYKVQRAEEYPDFGSQLDYIYHNGVDSWKTNIVDPVKAKYAKVEVDESEHATRKATALAEYQLEEYTVAQARLAQYELSVGRPEITEEYVSGEEEGEDGNSIDVISTRIVSEAIDALPATIDEVIVHPIDGKTTESIDNPAITQDNAERADAQAIVDATPQSVIDAYNAL